MIHLGTEPDSVTISNQSELKTKLSFDLSITRFILHVGSPHGIKTEVLYSSFSKYKATKQVQ